MTQPISSGALWKAEGTPLFFDGKRIGIESIRRRPALRASDMPMNRRGESDQAGSANRIGEGKPPSLCKTIFRSFRYAGFSSARA